MNSMTGKPEGMGEGGHDIFVSVSIHKIYWLQLIDHNNYTQLSILLL